MIVVRLNGGLGNQMFQYAAGFALARRNKDILRLDTSAFAQGPGRGETLRSLGLTDFQISAERLSPAEVLRRRNRFGPLSKAIRFVAKKGLRRYYVDWHPEVMRRKGDAYLEGYFQTEKYFREIAGEVCREFSLAEPLSGDVASIRHAIETGQGAAVSLHVRRGDYVSNPRNAPAMDICTPDYFRRAVEQLRGRVGDLRLVVFSDDVDWVAANIPETNGALFVSSSVSDSGQVLRPSQEMALMAACRHNIISNSTFSWWGAYLNPRPDKIVIAPSRWTNDPEVNHDNILPASWIRGAI